MLTKILESGDGAERPSKLQITLLQIDPEYELKDARFMGKGNILGLLRCPISEHDKPHSYVGLIETEELKKFEIETQAKYIDLLQELLKQPSKVSCSAMIKHLTFFY